MAKYFVLFIPACANAMEEHVMLQLQGDTAALKTAEYGRGQFLASTKERIMNLANEKVPPDALPFLATIKSTLTDSILPSIVDEKTQQVTFHSNLIDEFTRASLSYSADIGLLSDVQGEVRGAYRDHSTCRGLESTDHQETVTCASQQVVAQSTFDGHDSTVKSLRPGVCSDGAWRTDSVENLEAYSGALTNVIGSRVALDAKITECGGLQSDLETQTEVCNGEQTEYESKACTLAVGIHTAWQVYDGRYLSAKDAFEREFSVWEEQSGDRVTQCHLVGTLVCYITALEDHDDAAPLSAAIEACDGLRARACTEDVAFTHDNTPDQDPKVPVPAVACEDDFDYGEFPAGTSPSACTDCFPLHD